MSPSTPRQRLLRLCILLMAVFNLFALVVLLNFSPVLFTAFMFFAQPLFAVAFVLLLYGVLTELRAKQIL